MTDPLKEAESFTKIVTSIAIGLMILAGFAALVWYGLIAADEQVAIIQQATWGKR